MAYSKVTLSLPGDTLQAARSAADHAGTPFSAYVARALRNETLRRQVAAMAAAGELEPDNDWLDMAEADAEAGR